MDTEESYKVFRDRIYSYLLSYKLEKITKDQGIFRGLKSDYFLPENIVSKDYPAMLYDPIISVVEEIQNSEYKYKPHIFSKIHIASSQTACINLFIPILESPLADDILKRLNATPSNFDHIDRDELFHGYRLEFWDSTDDKDKGLLGDHSKQAGTDSDIAIAYRDKQGNLCLWLIEHKLTEKEFTECGGYKSEQKRKKKQNRLNKCLTSNFAEILADHSICYYHHKCGYNYWGIMSMSGVSDFFNGKLEIKGCPFRRGLNQLWRNQLLAIALERQVPNKYHEVYFSVVHHPENHFLTQSMNKYRELNNHSSKFGSFTSLDLIDAAKIDPQLSEWINWYVGVYLGRKTH